MKKHLLALLLLGCCFCSKAQWVTIPDANFAAWLNNNGYAVCMNGNQLDTTCSAVTSATTMYCSQANIQDLTGIQYFTHLRTLFCFDNLLTALPLLPDSITFLHCSYNLLTALPSLPSQLDSLYCKSNHINTLPSLPNSLTTFDCDNNQLTALPSLPNSLTKFICSRNQLSALPSLPNSLTYLDCGINQLSSLPALPNSLTTLLCYENQLLNTLQSLSNSLTVLSCFNNLLTALPILPNSLAYLDCDHNQLSTLPTLSNSLTTLNCDYNQLTVLPSLPNSLTRLYCYYNQLGALPLLPNSLTELRCDVNQLSTLPELPDSLGIFGCSHNPNLTCLPQLKKIRVFYFDSTGITCLPNYPQSNAGGSIPLLSSVPLCDIFNPNNCAVYYNISGKVYLDSNLNCVDDSAETPLINAPLNLYQNGSLINQTISYNVFGAYSFVTDTNTYTYSVDTNNLPFILFCPDSGHYTSIITAADLLDTAMNFGLRCKSGFDVCAHSIGGRFRPGNTRQLYVSAGDATNFYNAHCAAGTNGVVQLVISGLATYISPASGALTPTSVSNDTITWNVADFGVINFFSDFNINVATDTNAVLGSQICFTLILNPIAGDNNPSNNTLDYCGVVVSSFDPNEKEVHPTGNIDTATKWLTYTIHFQNTGTAEAQHIYVTDTLDTHVDPASFQLLAYSHQPMVQIKENAVRFNFPNINLPDSNTNEAASHGYVQYKVKLKDNLPVGTNISNTAFIYFDFNAPVVTNTTTNTIALNTGLRAVSQEPLAFRIYPNPANESVTISVSENMIGSSLTVYDVTGRKMAAVQLQTTNFKLETSRFSSGVYFVTVENKTGRVTRKLVIE